MTKKIATVIPLLIFVFFLSGCGPRDLPTEGPTEDGSYFYRNSSLEFSMLLPSTFKNYHTQRIEGEGYVDIEVFIPTSDTRFGKKVPGYAKPIVIRVFDEAKWVEVNQDENSIYKLLDDKKDKVYTILFWENEPKDWQARWNSIVEQEVVDGFRVE